METKQKAAVPATKEQIEQYAQEGYHQVCIWPGCYLPDDTTAKEFEETFEKQIISGCKVKYLEEVTTLPDVKNGKAVPETGGRIDLFFLMHDDCIEKYAVARLSMGIRWYEDVVKYNDHGNIYSDEILEKYPVRW